MYETFCLRHSRFYQPIATIPCVKDGFGISKMAVTSMSAKHALHVSLQLTQDAPAPAPPYRHYLIYLIYLITTPQAHSLSTTRLSAISPEKPTHPPSPPSQAQLEFPCTLLHSEAAADDTMPPTSHLLAPPLSLKVASTSSSPIRHSFRSHLIRPISTSSAKTYPRKDAQERDQINTGSTEYSKSGSDDDAAHKDVAFSPTHSKADEALGKAEEEVTQPYPLPFVLLHTPFIFLPASAASLLSPSQTLRPPKLLQI